MGPYTYNVINVETNTIKDNGDTRGGVDGITIVAKGDDNAAASKPHTKARTSITKSKPSPLQQCDPKVFAL